MKPIPAILLTAVILAATMFAPAQTPKPEDPAHQELRQLRDKLLVAMNKSDLEGILSLLHTNVVITWHNAEVSRGRDGVRAYYNRIMSGPNKYVESFTCNLNVDELTILYPGNTGISFGGADEQYTLANGKKLSVKGRWTGTLVKENGQWLVTSLHASTNLFDNVLLDVAKNMVKIAVVIALLAGGAIGWFIGRRRKATS
jgi:ketosteroid isomerase-like protein